jgi:hypothetical protein
MSKANKRKASLGTKVAAEMRTKANKLSDNERDESMSVAMQIIYGKGKATQHAVRR